MYFETISSNSFRATKKKKKRFVTKPAEKGLIHYECNKKILLIILLIGSDVVLVLKFHNKLM